MFEIFIDKHDEQKFLYEQVYEKLKQAILSRKITEHKRLPAKRQLANELNISLNTVTYAYEQLIAEGYIYAVERSGYYVEEIPILFQEDNIVDKLDESLREIKEDRETYLYSLSHMSSNAALFPFSEWRKCEQSAFHHHAWELSRITHQQGVYSVRKSIAEMIRLSREVVCEPEQIILGVGTQPLIEQLLHLLREDKPITLAVENPGYTRFYNQLNHLDINIRPVSLNQKGLSIQELESVKANIAFVTPSHQFPTGIIMPVSRRIELLNWAIKEKNRYIIEDDYDSEFKYETDYIPSLHSLDENESVIYMGSFSKCLLTSLRISYMVLPNDLLKKYKERYNHLIPANNTLTLLTLMYFIETGAYTRHIKRMTNYYAKVRSKLINNLNEKFGTKISIVDIPAGLHFIAHFKTEKSYEEIERLARVKRIEIYTLKRFMVFPLAEPRHMTIIIGFAILNNHIEETVDKLYEVIYE